MKATYIKTYILYTNMFVYQCLRSLFYTKQALYICTSAQCHILNEIFLFWLLSSSLNSLVFCLPENHGLPGTSLSLSVPQAVYPVTVFTYIYCCYCCHSLTEGCNLKWTFAKTFLSSSSFLYRTSILLDDFSQCSQASLRRSSSRFISIVFFVLLHFGATYIP